MTKPNFTYLALVLDRSGSMSSVWDATIEGFNTFINTQKAQPGEARITFVQFDDHYDVVYQNVPLAEMPALNRQNYQPRGSTALLDAIGRTVNALGDQLAAMPEEARPSKVIVVVQTDGAENFSRAYTREQIFEMITHQREKYSWEFVFLGADQDAIATATNLGIAAGNAMSYMSNDLSTQKAFLVSAAKVGSMRRGVDLNYSGVLRGAVTDANTTLDSFKTMIEQEEQKEDD